MTALCLSKASQCLCFLILPLPLSVFPNVFHESFLMMSGLDANLVLPKYLVIENVLGTL